MRSLAKVCSQVLNIAVFGPCRYVAVAVAVAVYLANISYILAFSPNTKNTQNSRRPNGVLLFSVFFVHFLREPSGKACGIVTSNACALEK